MLILKNEKTKLYYIFNGYIAAAYNDSSNRTAEN